MEWEDFQRTAKRKFEREQGRIDVRDDMSEDMSECEKGDIVDLGESPKRTYQHTASNLEVWSDDKKEKKLYIILIR